MDQRQVSFVAAAIRDDLAADGITLSDEQADRVAVSATKACINWMIAAAQEGMIDSVHVDSERPE
ncbi:hypothetical protein [Amycolatopsis sp.]|jgi:hypothetical protein|uniref:hypothetical protein n=1 Tax=Amycolatopsis sp. TaxID=37632 RepID=UPI002E0AA01A|nr:hypothetical protein [Amycolatopsis sp.]